MKFSSTLRVALWIMCLAAPVSQSAESIALRPSADTFLSQQNPDGNSGGGPDIVIGTQGPSAGITKNRGLIKFDLTGQIPPHSEIRAVALRLTVVKAPLLGPDSTFEVHRVLQPWNEAEATWNRIGTNAPWSAPGAAAPADFSTDVSAATGVSGLGNYTFGSTSNLVADVQSWVDTPGSNLGWILLTQAEDVAMSARRFASREAPTNAPALLIDYLLPPAIADVTRQDSKMTCHFTVEAG